MRAREFQTQRRNNMFGRTIRGQEAQKTTLMMGIEQIRTIFIIGAVLTVVLWAGTMAFGMDARERANLLAVEWKRLGTIVLTPMSPEATADAAVDVMDRGGEKHTVSIYLVPQTEWLAKEIRYNRALLDLWTAIGLSLTLFGAIVYTYFGYQTGRDNDRTRTLRGTSLVLPEELTKLIIAKSRIDATDRNLTKFPLYRLAGVPIPFDGETKHTIICGSTGTGKTQLILDLISQIRARGGKAIVLDTLQTFVGHFYDPETDVILNPFDQRSASWSPYLEAHDRAEWSLISKALIAPRDKDAYWIMAARAVMTQVGSETGRQKREATSKHLYDTFISAKDEQFQSYLDNSPANLHIPKDAPKQAAAVKATIAEALVSLSYMPSEKKAFSIREWMKDDSKRGILWISTENAKMEATRPLISTWLDIALWSLQECDRSKKRLVWFIMDELQSLQMLPSLEMGLAQARGYGGAYILGFHNRSQLQAIYGDKTAESILSNCRNTVVCSTSDPGTQEYFSNRIGRKEVEDATETLSMGTSTHRDGVSVSLRVDETPVVTPTEIGRLGDRQGYITMTGNFPATLARWDYVTRPLVHPHIVRFDRMDWNDKPPSGDPSTPSGSGPLIIQGTKLAERPRPTPPAPTRGRIEEEPEFKRLMKEYDAFQNPNSSAAMAVQIRINKYRDQWLAAHQANSAASGDGPGYEQDRDRDYDNTAQMTRERSFEKGETDRERMREIENERAEAFARHANPFGVPPGTQIKVTGLSASKETSSELEETRDTTKDRKKVRDKGRSREDDDGEMSF